MAKKSRALLVLDSQKLELNIPFKGVYDFASAKLKEQRFSRAEKIARKLKADVIALDSRTELYFRQRGIETLSAKEITENLYDLNSGEISFAFLQNLINTIECVDRTSTYNGISLPYLDVKNLWRTFVFPAITAFDTFSKILKSRKPSKAIILNHAHFYQKIFKAAAGHCGVKIKDETGSFASLPWLAKRTAMKSIGFIITPSYFKSMKAKRTAVLKGTKKKILIAHDTISPEKIIPWARKLTQDYEVVYVGVKEDKEKFKEAGITYRKLQDYATSQVIRNLKRSERNFKSAYKYIASSKEIAEALSYKGADLCEVFDEMMLFLYYISYPILARYVELFDEMIEIEEPDIVITVDELSRFGRALIRVANSKGVKTLLVQHGALLDHPLFSSIEATKFAAYGEQTRKILLKRGAKKGQVEIVGQAEEIPKAKPDKIKAKICNELGISKDRQIITFASQALPESVNCRSFEIFYRATKSLPKVQFVVKLHPDETENLHREFIRKLWLGNITIAKNVSTKELLVASDAVVNIYSTVGMEALSFGKPLISINASLPESYFPKGNGAYIVSDSKKLENTINLILGKNRRVLSESVKKLSRYYINSVGEKACKNVAKLVKNLVEK